MVKKIFVMTFFVTYIIISLTCVAKASGKEMHLKIGDSNVEVNGNFKTVDVPPVIENNRTMVPIRFITEQFGFLVEWQEYDKSIIIKTQTPNGTVIKSVRIHIDKLEATLGRNNDKTIIMDAPPLIKNGRTMVPIRFIAEAFDMIVDWDGNSKMVSVREKEYEFGQDINGYLIKYNKDGSIIKSDDYFVSFTNYNKDSAYLLASDEDNCLNLVSKRDMKSRKISSGSSIFQTYYNGLYYFSSWIDDDNNPETSQVEAIFVTDGKKETLLSSSEVIGIDKVVSNRLFFMPITSKKRDISYIDMNTSKVISLTNVGNVFEILERSEDNVIYVTERRGDEEKIEIRSVNISSKINTLLLSLKDLFVWGKVPYKDKLIIFANNSGIYSVDINAVVVEKLSDCTVSSFGVEGESYYFKNNILYFINDKSNSKNISSENMEIGYINLDNKEYTKVFSKKNIYGLYSKIRNIDAEGNIEFDVTLGNGTKPTSYTIFTYKYLLLENKIIFEKVQGGFQNYDPNFLMTDEGKGILQKGLQELGLYEGKPFEVDK